MIKRTDFPHKFTAPFNLHEVKFMRGAYETMNILKAMGFLRVVITNQPDVGYGYLTESVWQEVHNYIIQYFRPDDVFMCRHGGSSNCPMRKPSPMMLFAAADKWGIDLARSYMVGDTDKDMGAGRAAGCKTILLKHDYNERINADIYVDDLRQILKLIKNEPK